MGKATILSEIGSGQYSVSIIRERGRIAERITLLQEENTQMAEKIAELSISMAAAFDEQIAAASDLDDAIAMLSAPPTVEELENITEIKKALIEKEKNYQSLLSEKTYLELRVTANDKNIEKFNAAKGNETKLVWCADYTEGLSGDVGTVDIGMADISLQVIYPDDYQGPGKSAYDDQRDGNLHPILNGTPASTFLNYALLPGVEKWLPRYRVGVITSITDDLCTVLLDEIIQTHQSLGCNQTETVDCEIRYMSCNGAVFAVDDRVVVAFESMDWAQPKVIGFESNPKNCGTLLLMYCSRYNLLGVGYRYRWHNYIYNWVKNTLIELIQYSASNEFGVSPFKKMLAADRYDMTAAKLYQNAVEVAGWQLPTTVQIDAAISRSYDPASYTSFIRAAPGPANFTSEDCWYLYLEYGIGWIGPDWYEDHYSYALRAAYDGTVEEIVLLRSWTKVITDYGQENSALFADSRGTRMIVCRDYEIQVLNSETLATTATHAHPADPDDESVTLARFATEDLVVVLATPTSVITGGPGGGGKLYLLNLITGSYTFLVQHEYAMTDVSPLVTTRSGITYLYLWATLQPPSPGGIPVAGQQTMYRYVLEGETWVFDAQKTPPDGTLSSSIMTYSLALEAIPTAQ